MESNEMQSNEMQTQGPKSAGLSIASMVCGIVALVLSCCVPVVPFILALLGVVFGGVSLAKKMGGKGMAIAGLVCGIIGLVPAVYVIITGTGFLSMAGLM